MKVAFTSYEFPPLGSGIANYAYNLTEGLQEIENMQIDLYIPSISGPVRSSCNVIKVPTINIPILRMLTYAFNLGLMLKNRHYDIIHCNDISGCFIKSDIVTTHHSNLSQVKFYTSILRKIDSLILFIYEWLSIKNTREVIFVSLFSKNDYFNQIKIRKTYTVIPEGVNTQIFTPMDKDASRKLLNLPINKRIFLYVGRLNIHKNIQLMLNYLKDNGDSNNLFVIVGKGIYRKELENIVKEYGLHDKVQFRGFVEETQLKYYYSAADFSVNLSSIEGFGLTILEAMACGSIVVAANTSAMVEIINSGYNGYLLNITSGFNNELAAFFNQSSTKLKIIRENAFTTIHKYDWKNVASRVHTEYSKLIDNLK